VGERLWTELIRDAAPLEGLLRERARPPRANAEALNLHQLRAGSVAEIVDRLCADWSRFAQPVVIGDVQTNHEPQPVDREERDGPDRHRYWRWVYRVAVRGDTEILERWPELLDRPPLDGDEVFQPAPGPWLRSGDGTVFLFADVPIGVDVDGERPPSGEIAWIAEYLSAAIAAANDQVAAYDQALRAELTDTVARRLDRLERIAQGNAEVIELVRVRIAPIELVEAEDGPTVELAVAGPEPSASGPVDLRYALYGASAEDLLTAVRKWRNSVETYPAAFAKLGEEDISSVLVTTLNTVFDSAQREVFRSAGKTDIFVQAHVGQYDAAAHIAEAKIWGGKAQVAADLGQLLGYATARTDSQLVLYYVRNQNLGLITGRCAEVLEGHAVDGQVERRDRYDVALTVQHPTFQSPVAVSVMFVHLPDANAIDPDEPST
jgi:hypothetical protein